MKIAPLDRRVQIQNHGQSEVWPLSALRDRPFLVLIGEPGMGKSTALDHEAQAENGEVITCREAMNGIPMSGQATVFLDALDEYRTGNDGKDKLLQLANGLVTAASRRWRLTCRAEDWNAAADLKAVRRAAGNSQPVVATLLPLHRDEAIEMLIALKADDPEGFLGEARVRGAEAFIENPLSLVLLHSVVEADKAWPASRFHLFERAIHALGHEHDEARAHDPRPDVEAIIDTASMLCFHYLATGAKILWRSNTLPPSSNGDYLPLNTLSVAPALMEATIDTALFRGDGHEFIPFHRTVAEFLAARFLAKAVVGTPARAAFPLRRALTYIAGTDRQAPSELRGLYAWFTAHLHRLGDRQAALRLIENDAATVLAYGDAAAFDTEGRRAILFNLDREDPYFMSSHDGTTVLGSLAGEDLVPDFTEILDRDIRSHLQLTVLQALEDGRPVAGIQTKLSQIVYDADRQPWIRERAARIHIASSDDPAAAWRDVMDNLASQPLSSGQVMLRAQLLSLNKATAAQSSDIRSMLVDFAALPSGNRDETIDRGELTGLAYSLRKRGPSDLFDTPIAVHDGHSLRQKFEIRFFIDHALAGTILLHPDVAAERLWTWVLNCRENPWDMLDGSVSEAIQGWLDRAPEVRELALFLAIASADRSNDQPWSVLNAFTTATRRFPGNKLIDGLVALAEQEAAPLDQQRLLRLAAYVVRSGGGWETRRDALIARLREQGGNGEFIESLQTDHQAEYRQQEADRLAEHEAKTEASRQQNVASMTPQIPAILEGDGRNRETFGTLVWASSHYRNAMISQKSDPLDTITKYTNPEIAAAIAEGFVQFAIRAQLEIDAVDLGKIEAKLGAFTVEYVAAAGFHQALSNGRAAELQSTPLICALIALRQDYFGGDEGAMLDKWACQRLSIDVDAGADLLLSYWIAALDAGDDDLDGLDKLIRHDAHELVWACLTRLFHVRPNLPASALREALVAAALVMTDAEITQIVATSLSRADLSESQQRSWRFVDLVLDPSGPISELASEILEGILVGVDGEVVKAFRERCPNPDLLDLLRIQTLGARHAAREDDRRGANRSSAAVRAAIERLGASANPHAGKDLKALAPVVDASWSPQIAHSAAGHARTARDGAYARPLLANMVAALDGGPPVSPSDLEAIVLDDLDSYAASLRTASDMPWKRYWNTDKDGAAFEPQIENEDRDRLLELMRSRLEKYRIAAAEPEARRGENTRADILLLSHAGKNLPVEAKRHYNRELWTAPLEQLSGYAADVNAFGFGIYLVFWFGKEFRVPARTDRKAKPKTARELETMLIDDIPAHLRDKLSIVVLDVSRPPEMIAAIAKRQEAKSNRPTEK